MAGAATGRWGRAALAIACFGLIASCKADPPAQPPGWDDDLKLATTKDLNPDPHVLEVNLTASVTELHFTSAGSTPAWTYNATVPGPLLELTRGDRLIVHFTNDLPEPTTIHWHGVRVPADMDGMPGHSQDAVEPGGTFDYDFVVPDSGLFWYHPHANAAKQLGYGLYGALWVHPAKGDPEPMPGELGDELVLVLSDIGLDDAGGLTDPEEGGELASVFGREGTTILVNGHPHPSLDVRSGLRQRWHLLNAAKSRFFQLALPGHRFTQIGTDGGLMASGVESDTLLIVPGERADVLVTPTGEANAELGLRWIPYDRGFGTFELKNPEEILRMFFDATPPEGELPPIKPFKKGPTIEPLDTSGATTVTLQLTQIKNDAGHAELGINGIPFDQAEPLEAVVGETQVWSVENTMQWDHPFHLHGFFFQPLDADGAPIEPLSWRDTVNIPVGTTARFAVRYDNRPGMWMFHCHVLDHEGLGMMGMINLVRP